MVTIHPPARLVGEPKKTKKEGRKEGRKKDTQNSGKLAIRPDHPRRRIKIKLCTVGGLRCVVLMSSVIQNGQGVKALWWVENGPSPLLWPVAYTTACTAVQAVKNVDAICRTNVQRICSRTAFSRSRSKTNDFQGQDQRSSSPRSRPVIFIIIIYLLKTQLKLTVVM